MVKFMKQCTTQILPSSYIFMPIDTASSAFNLELFQNKHRQILLDNPLHTSSVYHLESVNFKRLYSGRYKSFCHDVFTSCWAYLDLEFYQIHFYLVAFSSIFEFLIKMKIIKNQES